MTELVEGEPASDLEPGPLVDAQRPVGVLRVHVQRGLVEAVGARQLESLAPWRAALAAVNT